MSDPKFGPTPEPWQVFEDPVGIRVYKPNLTGPGLIAEFPNFSQSITGPGIPVDEVRSNARLFMLAPRMLRFLLLFHEAVNDESKVKALSDESLALLAELKL